MCNKYIDENDVIWNMTTMCILVAYSPGASDGENGIFRVNQVSIMPTDNLTTYQEQPFKLYLSSMVRDFKYLRHISVV